MEGLSLTDFWVSRITAFNAYAALVLLVWDWLICLDDEINWTWPQPCTTKFKWVYFFCRYAALAFHLLNVLFVRRMEQYIAFQVSTCRLWLAYQGIVVEIFYAIVEGLLMIRVYGLWGRSKRILALLALFIVMEVACSVITTTFITREAHFNQLCLFKKPLLLIVLFSVAALLTQLSIISLTLLKQYRLRHPELSAVVRSVAREGNVVSFTVCALFVAGFVCLSIDAEYGDVMFCWVLSILSVCGCRLILTVHRLSSPQRPEAAADDVCLTSIIEQGPLVP